MRNIFGCASRRWVFRRVQQRLQIGLISDRGLKRSLGLHDAVNGPRLADGRGGMLQMIGGSLARVMNIVGITVMFRLTF